MDLKTFTGLPFYIKLACVLFSLFAIGYLVILGKEILSPLVFSCLFSILLLPVAKFFEFKLRLARSVASMLSVLLLLTFIGGLIYVIASQIADLLKDWPESRRRSATPYGSSGDGYRNICMSVAVNSCR